MTRIPFFKMCGSGNDFIIVDNRGHALPEAGLPDLARRLCARTMSLGADGFVVVEASATADFRWHFFNSDGSRADMCGNAARCVARFACLTGIAGQGLSFDTGAGVIAARVTGDRVKVRMTDPREMESGLTLETSRGLVALSRIHTGVPHVVVSVTDVARADVLGLGRELRYHPAFAPAGTNVNFAAVDGAGQIHNRTYERGVEGETLACGTGAVAAALLLAGQGKVASPVTVVPRSGETLMVYFERAVDGFREVFLEGNARVICTGELWEDAWNWSAEPALPKLGGSGMEKP